MGVEKTTRCPDYGKMVPNSVEGCSDRYCVCDGFGSCIPTPLPSRLRTATRASRMQTVYEKLLGRLNLLLSATGPLWICRLDLQWLEAQTGGKQNAECSLRVRRAVTSAQCTQLNHVALPAHSPISHFLCGVWRGAYVLRCTCPKDGPCKHFHPAHIASRLYQYS